MASKHYPVIRHSELYNNTTTASTKLLSVSKELSKLNKRMYRQSRCYTVKVDLNFQSSSTQVAVYALRNDWSLHGAIKEAYSAYRDATKEERANLTSSQLARWEDFRIAHGIVSYDEIHGGMRSRDLQGSRFGTGEFPLSSVVDKNGNEKTFTLGVAGVNEFDIIGEYDAKSNMQESPEDLAGGSYNELNANEDAVTVQNLQDKGNLPPYNGDTMNAATPWVLIGYIGTAASTHKLSTGYFDAPLGLIAIGGIQDNDVNDLMFTVQSGDYKGVRSVSMLE